MSELTREKVLAKLPKEQQLAIEAMRRSKNARVVLPKSHYVKVVGSFTRA